MGVVINVVRALADFDGTEVLGKVTASPTANTVLARLKTVADTIELIRSTDGIKKIVDALPVGSNLIGKVILRNPGNTLDIGDAANPVRTDPTGTTAQPVSNAVATQADGHSASIGATSDADTALTVIGRLKKTVALLAGGLPAALTGAGSLKTALLEAIPAGSNLIGRVRLRNPGDTVDLGDATNPVRIDPTGTTTQPALVRGRDVDSGFIITIDAQNIAGEERLKVLVGENPDNPVYIAQAIGSRTYYSAQFVQANTPARVSSSGAGPYSVGNTTLSITINGSLQTYLFASRGASAGYSTSALEPATANGGNKKVRFSIDGGAVKEVQIATNLTSGAAIAAALQTQIRALVANGTNVTVDFGVTNPGRFTVTSGTTGPSSSVVVTKGGDNLAVLLKLGVAQGGIEFAGLAVNSYRNTEVRDLLNVGLTDVDVGLLTDGKVEIVTRAGGASATIQVSAGGSNTQLGYTTSLVTGTTGTGSSQLNVNGSVTPIRFSLDIPVGYTLTVIELLFLIRDTGGTNKTFGGLAQLTNGIIAEYKTSDQPTGTLLTAVTNGELIAQVDLGQVMVDAYSDNAELVYAKLNLVAGVRLRPSTSDGIFITVRDNLTGLDAFTVRARGWLES